MNNLSASLKKFLGNKNTVTILGVALCVVILIVGYNRTINSKIKLTNVPYALQTIQPKTQIKNEMVGEMMVPEAFIKVGDYHRSRQEIVGKYSNYNTIIAEGSLFYKGLITDKGNIPDQYLENVPKGYIPLMLNVNMQETYANTMMVGNYINLYFKALLPADEQKDEANGEIKKDKIMYGKFMSNIEILALKDSQGKHVHENSEEARVPAYMIFAISEEQFLLIKKAAYLQNRYAVELSLVPNTSELPDDITVKVSSEEIKEFIEIRTEEVDIKEIDEADPSDILKPDNNEEQQTQE